jgi:pimeloyl-ACP methyl ester carboxylesterase
VVTTMMKKKSAHFRSPLSPLSPIFEVPASLLTLHRCSLSPSVCTRLFRCARYQRPAVEKTCCAGVSVPTMLRFNHTAIRFKPLLWGLIVAILATACGSTAEQSTPQDSSSPQESTGRGITESSRTQLSRERIDVGDTRAFLCGEGNYGVVMAHGASYDATSWEGQAQRIAQEGMVALAVEDTSPQNLLTAAEYLKGERGIRGVAFLGASAGGSAVLQAAGNSPEVPDQLILLSAVGDVSGLGEEPKLFVASEGEGRLSEEVRQMAEKAPGDRNEVLVLPGDAHAQAIFETNQGERLTQAILERLKEQA